MNVKNFLKWIVLINSLFISNVNSLNSLNQIDSIQSINKTKWSQKNKQHTMQNSFFLKKSYQI